MKKNKRHVTLASVLLVSSFLIIFVFTSINGVESNQMSQAVAKRITAIMTNHFYVNRHDEFWNVTLNQLLRKIGHILEFAYAGMASSYFFLVLMRNKMAAVLLSLVTCSLYALSDEFHQMFISGRTPLWFDVQTDILGAVLGIAFAGLAYFIYRRFSALRHRIKELEGKA